MNPSLKKFRNYYRELLLSLLWRHWSSLGVMGYGESENCRIIDPEALLLFTCTIGRLDSRMFDEVLNWLDANGRFINIQRMRTIMNKECFSGQRVIAAIASIMSERAAALKWKRLSLEGKENEPVESLFFESNGLPMKLFGVPDEKFMKYGLHRGKMIFRGHATPFRPSLKSNLALKLRAFMGVNARCEILVYLLTHDRGHPAQVARETYYYKKTVQDTLIDMSKSGLIQMNPMGKEKHYSLRPGQWTFLTEDNKAFPRWLNWPPILSALEKIWLKCTDSALFDLDPLLQSSELRCLMQTIRPLFQKAGLGHILSDESAHLGKEYIDVFIADIKKLVTSLIQPLPGP